MSAPNLAARPGYTLRNRNKCQDCGLRYASIVECLRCGHRICLTVCAARNPALRAQYDRGCPCSQPGQRPRPRPLQRVPEQGTTRSDQPDSHQTPSTITSAAMALATMQHTLSNSTTENQTDSAAQIEQQARILGGADTSAISSTPASTHASAAIPAVTAAPAPVPSAYSTFSEPHLSPASARTAVTVDETRQLIHGTEGVLRLPSFNTLLSRTQANLPPPHSLHETILDPCDTPLPQEASNETAESSQDRRDVSGREAHTQNATRYATVTTHKHTQPLQDLSSYQATSSQHIASDVQSGHEPHSTSVHTSDSSNDSIQNLLASQQVAANSYPASEPATPVIQSQPDTPPVQVLINLDTTIPRSMVNQPLLPSHGLSVIGTQGLITHDDGLELLRTYREMELQRNEHYQIHSGLQLTRSDSLATSTIRGSPTRSSQGLDISSGAAVDDAQPSISGVEAENSANVEVELSTSTNPEASTKDNDTHVVTTALENPAHTDADAPANVGSSLSRQNHPPAFASDGAAEGQAIQPITVAQSRQDIDYADLSSYRFAAEQQALRAARQPSEDTIPARSFGSTQDEEEDQGPARKKRRVE